MSLPTACCLLLATLLASCESPQPAKPELIPAPGNRQTVHHPDSTRYTHIAYDFYRNEHGHLFEQKQTVAADIDGGSTLYIFYDSCFREWYGDEPRLIPLDSIVDVKSYTPVPSSSFSKDKRHVYFFQGNSDGGTRYIVYGADPSSFERLADYRWGRDARFVYYTTDRVENADPATIEVLYPADTTNPLVDYVRDHRRVFYQGNRVTGADARSFRLVSDSAWDAADNSNRYRAGALYNDPR